MFISAYVYILYLIALQFEGYVELGAVTLVVINSMVLYRPFTDMIYSKRAKAASKKTT